MDRESFVNVLVENPGWVIVKFGATWCKPCLAINAYIGQYFDAAPKSHRCLKLDVDENPDIYAHLRAKKQVTGIPVLLAYKKGNLTPFADVSVTGSSRPHIDAFFKTIHASVEKSTQP